MGSESGWVTSAEVEHAERRVGYARDEVEAREDALRARREAIAQGHAAAEAAQLRAALADPAVWAAVEALDRAEARLCTAEAELRRCGSRRGWGARPTELALQRQNAAALARERALAAREVIRGEAARVGVALSALRSDGGGAWLASALQSRLRAYEELTCEGDLPRKVTAAKAALAAREAELAQAHARRIPTERVEALARALDPKERDLLARLVNGGYSPKPATVRKDPRFASLGAHGLVNGATPTSIGVEVLRWASAHLPVGIKGLLRTIAPPAGWRSAHRPAERREMAARAKAVLAEIADDVESAELVELGAPERGYSYRLVRRVDVIQGFLRALGREAVEA